MTYTLSDIADYVVPKYLYVQLPSYDLATYSLSNVAN